MISSYFTIAWRSIQKNRAAAFINIAGLALGVTCAVLIYTLVSYQLSFDNFHPNANRIYRTVSLFHYETTENQPGVPQPIGKAFRNEFSFAEKTAMVNVYENALISLPGSPDKKYEETNGVAYAEPDFFDIFHFPLVQGDKQTALTQPNTALITQHLAQKYFGTENAIGKLIRFDNKRDFVITGILKNIPANTDRKQEIYLSYSNMKDKSAWLASDSSWGSVRSSMNFFMLLKPGVTAATVNAAYPGLVKKYLDKEDAKATEFLLQPLSDIHFNTDFDGSANKKYLWALGIIGVFLLITACVNFINLATAQALNRAKEVGVRKVMGSKPAQLFWQFISEAAVISFFAILVAYGIACLVLPWLNHLFTLHLSVNLFRTPIILLFLVLVWLGITFGAGSYPALLLTRFQPILALKGNLQQKHIGGFSLRRVLVIVQFSISQVLIIGAIVITAQLYYSSTANAGFDKDAIVMLPIPGGSTALQQHTLQTRLLQINGVQKVSLCYEAPASEANSYTTIQLENEPKIKPWDINQKEVDAQYASTFGLQFVAGGNFIRDDTLSGFILNETAVKKLGIAHPQDAIGKMLTTNGDNYKAPVTGVVKDFNNQSFRARIDPIALMVAPKYYRNCAIKVNSAHVQSLLAAVENIWTSTFPQHIYKYQFLEERLTRFYAWDNMMLQLVKLFACIAIFIGCLGLYGLVAFMAVQKSREIGVRKVLGATLASIVWLFGKELSLLLLIAFVIAAPAGWWMMHKYLQDFAYHIHMGAGVFVLAIAASAVVAAITVSYRSLKAARTSPIKSLKQN